MPSLRTPRVVSAAVLVAALLVLAGLQVINHRKVHESLCSAPGVTCNPGAGWLAIEARIDPAMLPPGLLAQPLQVQARSALVRHDCDAKWQAAFGARIGLGPLDLGKHFKSQGACVDVFRQAARGRLLQAQLSCEGRHVAARLEPATVHWGKDLAVKLQADVAADAQATCAALWREAPGDGSDGLPAVKRLALDLRWGLPFEEAGKLFAAPAAPAAPAARCWRWRPARGQRRAHPSQRAAPRRLPPLRILPAPAVATARAAALAARPRPPGPPPGPAHAAIADWPRNR